MNETAEELDLAACSRRARRWAIGLACLLGLNFSLVALALAGFGARPNPQHDGLLAAVPPPRDAQKTAQPARAQSHARPPAAKAALVIEQADKPPIADAPVARMAEGKPVEPTPVEPPQLEDPPQPHAPDPPPVPPAPPAARTPPPAVAPATASLIVVNPPATGGAVHFAIDGVVYTLAPGEYRELSGTVTRRVQYHQGDQFGYASHRLDSGVHAFGLAANGWTLKPLDASVARKLLLECQQK
jgi:hypothetical protein